MLYVALAAAVAALGLWSLGVRAYRDEYLMVLHWPDAGTLLFERVDGVRYVPVKVYALPLVALRFGVHAVQARTSRGAAEKRIATPAPAALAHR